MIRLLFAFVLSLWLATNAMAHFVFIVPEPGGSKANVLLSEDLRPDEDVDVSIVAGAKLSCRDAAGGKKMLELHKAEHGYSVDLPAGTRVIHGDADLGIHQRGDSKPHWLVYHPKTIVGDAFDSKATLGDAVPVEIVPLGKPGELRLQVRIKGKAAAGIEVNLVLPDGSRDKSTTGADGQTAPLNKPGRYGAWARYFEPTPGRQGDKTYEEIRHYATLVLDIDAASGATGEKAAASAVAASPSRRLPLPEAVSSFGAVVNDGWLYVYGGHTAKTHSYSTTAVSGQFHRLSLTDGAAWEKLPGATPLQGMNLAAFGGKIYRIGGMEPRNAPSEKADTYSIADCARFDPAKGAWEALPQLPNPRSSHDVAVIDGKLYVIGGWAMNGKAGNHWLGTFDVLDLKAEKLQWTSIKQPFERRALIAAVYEGKLYAIGGFTEESDPSRRVEIYDPKAGAWSSGPEIPGPDTNGFAPAACTIGGRLYVSVGDGSLYRLSVTGKVWDKIASTTPRIVHRLAPHADQILVVGGAAKGDNLDLIEAVTVPTEKASGDASPSDAVGNAK